MLLFAVGLTLTPASYGCENQQRRFRSYQALYKWRVCNLSMQVRRIADPPHIDFGHALACVIGLRCYHLQHCTALHSCGMAMGEAMDRKVSNIFEAAPRSLSWGTPFPCDLQLLGLWCEKLGFQADPSSMSSLCRTCAMWRRIGGTIGGAHLCFAECTDRACFSGLCSEATSCHPLGFRPVRDDGRHRLPQARLARARHLHRLSSYAADRSCILESS